MKEIIVSIFGAALVNNFVFEKGYGLVSAVSSNKILKLGICTILSVIVSSLVLNIANGLLLAANLQFLANFCYILLTILITVLVCKVAKLDKENFILTVLNSAIIACGLNCINDACSLADTLFHGSMAGIGYLASLYLINGLNDRLNNEGVPSSFKGLPIRFLTCGIIALALLAFK